LVVPLTEDPPQDIVYFIKGNIMSLKSKKQNVIVQSRIEVEYRSMALATCELATSARAEIL